MLKWVKASNSWKCTAAKSEQQAAQQQPQWPDTGHRYRYRLPVQTIQTQILQRDGVQTAAWKTMTSSILDCLIRGWSGWQTSANHSCTASTQSERSAVTGLFWSTSCVLIFLYSQWVMRQFYWLSSNFANAGAAFWRSIFSFLRPKNVTILCHLWNAQMTIIHSEERSAVFMVKNKISQRQCRKKWAKIFESFQIVFSFKHQRLRTV